MDVQNIVHQFSSAWWNSKFHVYAFDVIWYMSSEQKFIYFCPVPFLLWLPGFVIHLWSILLFPLFLFIYVFCLFYFIHSIIFCLSFSTSSSTSFFPPSSALSPCYRLFLHCLSFSISLLLNFFLLCLPTSPSSNISPSLTCYSIVLSSIPSFSLTLELNLFTKRLFVIGWICMFDKSSAH